MKRPNKRYRRRIRFLYQVDDEDVLFQRLCCLPQVVAYRMSPGYYGSVSVTCSDGKKVLVLVRDHWDHRNPPLRAVRQCFLRLGRYLRRRRNWTS